MRLAAVRIQDFRSIENLVLKLGRVTVLVGENNAGKTLILQALAIGLGSQRASGDDLRIGPAGDRASRFVIDLLIQPAEGDDFDLELTEVLGTAVQLPDDAPNFAVLRTVGQQSPIPGRLDVRRQFMQGWATDRGEAEKLVAVAAGVPRAWGERVLFQFLDAQRDLAADLGRRGSFWGRIARDPELPSALAAEVEATLRELGARIAAESPVLEEMRKALQLVVDTATTGGVELAPLPTQPDELLRALDVLVRAPGSASIPMGSQGSGTRSLAALMVFRAYVALEQIRAISPPLVVTALEEIEAHLHPQAARTVEPLLRTLPGQVLLSTHSPHVIDRIDLTEIRTVHRQQAAVRIGTVEGMAPLDLENAKRWVQRHQSELLFARLVVLVEGDAEESMLEPFAAARWECPPGLRGVSIVNATGAQNFKHFVTVLERLEITWLVMADGDAAGMSGVRNAGKAIDRPLDATSPAVVVLTGGHAIEPYLVAEGFSGELEAAVAVVHGPDALASWRTTNHGGLAKKGMTTRDYQSDGWEERLIVDFLDIEKTGWGAAFARRCLQDPARVPSAIEEVLTSAELLLAGVSS